MIRDYKNNSWVDIEPNQMPTMKPSEIEAALHQALEQYSRETFPAEHRNHLGISIIGDDCSRKLWYMFRWVKLTQAEGRMRRLWNRGHREEPIFEKFLMWAGVKIRTIDPKTDKQYKLSLVNGHYGGSGDGVGLISWLEDLPILTEFKTHNNKSFTELKEKGVVVSKPQHWAQMCGYGKDFGIKHSLYCAVNKDTDEVYFKFLELDWNLAVSLENKARDIIYSQTPPSKVNENPSYWKCKFCDYRGTCHYGEAIEKNCRSCVNASPADNGEWACRLYGVIPKEFIIKGCDVWQAIV